MKTEFLLKNNNILVYEQLAQGCLMSNHLVTNYSE